MDGLLREIEISPILERLKVILTEAGQTPDLEISSDGKQKVVIVHPLERRIWVTFEPDDECECIILSFFWKHRTIPQELCGPIESLARERNGYLPTGEWDVLNIPTLHSACCRCTLRYRLLCSADATLPNVVVRKGLAHLFAVGLQQMQSVLPRLNEICSLN